MKKAFLKLRGLVAFEQLRLIALLVSFLKAFKTQNGTNEQISTFWHRYPDIIVDCSFIFSLNTNYRIELFGVCKVEKMMCFLNDLALFISLVLRDPNTGMIVRRALET